MHFASKKQIVEAVVALLFLIFIFLPHPASALYLRITFEQLEGDDCFLYYTTDTDGNFSEDKCIASRIDPDTMQVAFRLDGALDGHLTGLRLDFPHTEQLLGIRTVTVSSAGVIKKEYNPCYLFTQENFQMNHNADITLIPAWNRAYISTSADDPFLILSDALTSEITGCYSHQTGSRLLLCLFIAGCFFFADRNFFPSSV